MRPLPPLSFFSHLSIVHTRAVRLSCLRDYLVTTTLMEIAENDLFHAQSTHGIPPPLRPCRFSPKTERHTCTLFCR